MLIAVTSVSEAIVIFLQLNL